MENSHINESILSEEILEDQKKNRIDHMTYLPGMEDIGSDVMDQVISAMNAYDYEKYTEADVRRAIAHDIRTPEDFAALLSPAALPLLEEIAQGCTGRDTKTFRKQRLHVYSDLHCKLLRKLLIFTVVSTATTRSTVHS